jgi:hypothetical protein
MPSAEERQCQRVHAALETVMYIAVLLPDVFVILGTGGIGIISTAGIKRVRILASR